MPRTLNYLIRWKHFKYIAKVTYLGEKIHTPRGEYLKKEMKPSWFAMSIYVYCELDRKEFGSLWTISCIKHIAILRRDISRRGPNCKDYRRQKVGFSASVVLWTYSDELWKHRGHLGPARGQGIWATERHNAREKHIRIMPDNRKCGEAVDERNDQLRWLLRPKPMDSALISFRTSSVSPWVWRSSTKAAKGPKAESY